MVRRVGKKHNHSITVKGKCRPKGARGQFFAETKAQYLRRKGRTQSLFNLLLAGDFHPSSETKDLPVRSHMMRVMLVSNLAVDQRFANGTQVLLYLDCHRCPSVELTVCIVVVTSVILINLAHRLVSASSCTSP